MRIELTARALHVVETMALPLDRVRRMIDDWIVDHGSSQMLRRDELGKLSVGVTSDLVRHVLALDDSPGPAGPTNGRAPGLLSEEPCESCLFTGRLQPRPMHDRGIRMPGAAVCVHRSVPLLQRRSAARAPEGTCGPEARLHRDGHARPPRAESAAGTASTNGRKTAPASSA